MTKEDLFNCINNIKKIHEYYGVKIIFIFIFLIFFDKNLSAQDYNQNEFLDFRGSYQPLSRTSASITGPIKISKENGKLYIYFQGKGPFSLLSKGMVSGKWDGIDSGKIINAQIYEIDRDPGQLMNGNSLCGNTNAHYLVFYDDILYGEHLLELEVFSSLDSPSSIDSNGLCGTFNYENNNKILRSSQLTSQSQKVLGDNSKELTDIYDMKKYCADVGETAGGSYEIEQTCREQEKKSQNNLSYLSVPKRVATYCQNVGQYAGGSYQIMETCIENELKAKKQLEP